MHRKYWLLYGFQDLLAADHLVAVVPLGQLSERRLNDTTTQTQHQMQSGFWWVGVTNNDVNLKFRNIQKQRNIFYQGIS